MAWRNAREIRLLSNFVEPDWVIPRSVLTQYAKLVGSASEGATTG